MNRPENETLPPEFLNRLRSDAARPAASDSSWPRISVVTPSFNQARYLERTILSVLNQDYPNLEYIIIDGGSVDGSLDILKRYGRFLSGWVSEPDGGQSDALNKGFARTTGEVLAWLNSDDAYLPGALRFVGRWFAAHPRVDLLFGDTLLVDEDDRPLRSLKDVRFSSGALKYGAVNLVQPNAFWRRKVFFRAGGLRTEYRYCLDVDLFARMLNGGACFRHIRRTLAAFRLHAAAKTATHRSGFAEESRRLRGESGWPLLETRRAKVMGGLFRLRKAVLLLAQGDLGYLLTRRDRRRATPVAASASPSSPRRDPP